MFQKHVACFELVWHVFVNRNGAFVHGNLPWCDANGSDVQLNMDSCARYPRVSAQLCGQMQPLMQRYYARLCTEWCPFPPPSRPSPHTRRRSRGRSNPGRISRSREDHGRGGTSVSGGPRSRGDFGRGGTAVAGEPRPRRDRSRGGTAVMRGAWGVDSGGGTPQRRQRRGGRGGADRGRPWGWRGGGTGGRGRGEGGWWFRTVFSAVPAV